MILDQPENNRTLPLGGQWIFDGALGDLVSAADASLILEWRLSVSDGQELRGFCDLGGGITITDPTTRAFRVVYEPTADIAPDVYDWEIYYERPGDGRDVYAAGTVLAVDSLRRRHPEGEVPVRPPFLPSTTVLYPPTVTGGEQRNGKQVGLVGLSYFMGFSPFLNWAKLSSVLTVERSAGGNLVGTDAFDAGILDGEGDLITPVPAAVTAWHTLIHARTFNVGEQMGGESFRVDWSGTGTLAIDFIAGAGAVPFTVDGDHTGTFTCGADQDHIRLRIVPDATDPIQPSSVRIYQTRYAANVAAGERFNPDWVAELREFETVRLMDWPATNGSTIANTSQVAGLDYYQWGTRPGAWPTGDGCGPKGGIPWQVMAELAAETECVVWICIPHLATDAYVTALATYCRDNIPTPVKLEWSNEVWNTVFQQNAYAAAQGEAKWPGLYAPHEDAWRWYGYRSAQVMKLIRDTYGLGNRARWRGVLAAFTAVPATVEGSLAGLAAWQGEGHPETVTDLFDEIAVTSYFGGVVDDAGGITAIATGAQTAITTAEPHGMSAGTRIIIAMNACGLTGLNGLTGTIQAAGLTANTFTLNINSAAFSPAYTPGSPPAYWARARLFDLMDQSAAANPGDPYRVFVEDFAATVLAGTSPSGLMPAAGTLPDHIDPTDGWWTLHKAIADANGLELTQYEGGSHFTGNVFLNGYPDRNVIENRFTAALQATSHRPEMAELYTRFAEEFVALGGIEPSKFVEGGAVGRFGTWGGVRHWPMAADPDGDLANPVWLAVKAPVAAGP